MGKSLTLDFIYGNLTKDKVFQPLDGQQRLTTLWLLNWYISFTLGNLDEDIRWLKNFTYDTRISSRNFLQILCEKMVTIKKNNIKENTIAEYIKKQTWFYSEWEQDPTVDALLRTLSGNNDEKNDNIESIFLNYSNKDLKRAMELLNKAQLINFEELTINSKQLPVSDDLYIKMNARGKQLTNFENFKADLIKFIQSNDIMFTVDAKNEFLIQIDGDWTDVFWKECVLKNAKFHESDSQPRVDEAMFMFINRYLFNEVCLGDISINKENTVNGEQKDLYDYLYGRNLQKTGRKKYINNDSLIKYENFELYKKFITFTHINSINIILKKLKTNEDILNKINIFFEKGLSGFNETENEDTEDEIEYAPVKEDYSFISKYFQEKDDDLIFGIKKTELKERIYFLAICRYIEFSQDFKEDVFKRWMRIIKNLTENAQVENENSLINVLRIVNKLSCECNKNNWDVYSTILNFEVSGDNLLSEQLQEEKEKIEQIKIDNKIENQIIKAENYSFFNGTIRFLYRGENGEKDWENFEVKLNNSQLLFKEDRIETKVLRDFLYLFKKFDDCIKNKYYFTNIGYHNRIPCWKRNILCDITCCKQVHILLMGNIKDSDKIAEGKYREFIESKLLDKILESGKYIYQGSDYIHKANGIKDESYIYIDDSRIANNIIIAKKAIIRDSEINYDKGFYFGATTPFTYNGENYCLKCNNEIMKCDSNWIILNKKIDKRIEDFFD